MHGIPGCKVLVRSIHVEHHPSVDFCGVLCAVRLRSPSKPLARLLLSDLLLVAPRRQDRKDRFPTLSLGMTHSAAPAFRKSHRHFLM